MFPSDTTQSPTPSSGFASLFTRSLLRPALTPLRDRSVSMFSIFTRRSSTVGNCSRREQVRAKIVQINFLISIAYKQIISQTLSTHNFTNASGGVFPTPRTSSLPFSVLATIPFRITFFAHPHHLTATESNSYKKQGRGIGTRAMNNSTQVLPLFSTAGKHPAHTDAC